MFLKTVKKRWKYPSHLPTKIFSFLIFLLLICLFIFAQILPMREWEKEDMEIKKKKLHKHSRTLFLAPKHLQPFSLACYRRYWGLSCLIRKKGSKEQIQCGGIRLNLANTCQEGQSLSCSDLEQCNDQSQGSSSLLLFPSRVERLSPEWNCLYSP